MNNNQISYHKEWMSVKNASKSKKKKNQAIHSYGIILYTYINDEIYFLLYKRRDNFEYMDFIRGLWSSKGQLPCLFSLMNNEERDRIRNYTFSELWDDLWIEHSSRIYRDGKERANRKYNSVYDYIPKLLETTNSQISSTPWGFPKGKKNSSKEKAITCALREFSEETCIPSYNIEIINYLPFCERFTGSNGKLYATNYYLAYMPYDEALKHFPEKKNTPNCIREETISEEASDVDWFNYSNACQKLNHRRQLMLKDVINYLKSIPAEHNNKTNNQSYQS